MTAIGRSKQHLLAASRAELMDLWRVCLTHGQPIDPYDAVVAELSEYFQLPPEEVHRRCQHWEQESVEQWHAQDRSSPEQVVEFFQTQTSWIFDTMRYHAEQCKGQALPESVEVAHGLRQLQPGQHLDFGAGPGTSSMFFHQLGWKVALADISTTFLDFARWRLERHGVPATFYNTSREYLPEATFDLITAFDVMVHIPDVQAALANVQRALRPGGYFVFNIDSRPRGPTTEYHFFEAHYPVLRPVRRIGFRRERNIDFFYVYQKKDRTAFDAQFVSTYDGLRYNRQVHAATQVARKLKSLIAR